MNRDLDITRLPEPVERYFREVATMQPPADLMDDVIERIEATPSQPRPISTFLVPIAAALLVVAVIGAGVWAFSPAGPIGIGGPTDQASPTTEASPTPVAAAPTPDFDAMQGLTFPTREVRGFAAYPMRAEGHGSLWMYMWDLNTVVRWDPATGAEQTRIDLGERDATSVDHRDAALHLTDAAVYVGDGDDRIMAIDPVTNEVTEFAEGVRPTDLATDGETLWAVDLHHDEVIRYDLESGEEIARILLPDQPSSVDLGEGGDPWVVSPEGLLVRIDAEVNDIAAEYPIEPGASFVDVVGDDVFISGLFRPLERFSISAEQVVLRGARLGEVQEFAGLLVGTDRAGYVAFLDPATLEWRSIMEVAPFGNAYIIPGDGGFWFGGDGDVNLAIFVDLSG